MVATSASLTGTPLRLAITSAAKSRGVCSAPLAVTVIWLTPLLSVPCGELTLAARSALATSLVVMPLITSALAFSAMRTAYGVPPPICTWATPGICATAGFSRVSVRSYNWSGGRLVEVSVTSSTGIFEVSNLKYCGGVGRPGGRSAAAALIAACTSRAASSVVRPKSNSTWICAPPSLAVDAICFTPGMRPRCRSSGATTVLAMVCALAPGMFATTTTPGNSIDGNAATPSSRYAMKPARISPIASSEVPTGRRIMGAKMFT